MTNVVGDTSIIIAAVSSWHPAHKQAAVSLKDVRVAISHTLAEAYSSLTRMPPSQRVLPSKTLDFFIEQFTTEIPVPPYLPALNELAQLEITGGATYDGLIALAARRAGLKLLTLDQRAARTYEAVGVEYEILN